MDPIEPTTGDPARRIPLQGPGNFRDLGGYAAASERTVRWRLLYRTDGLSTLTDADHRVLIEDLGLTTIIDLRAPEEVAASIPTGLIEAGVRHLNVAIFDETRQLWRDDDGPGFTIAQLYFRMLDMSSDRFVEALQLVVAAPGPVVFHCAAGKDRTGILAAALLGLLGVSEQDIVADYALTAAIVPVLRARFEASAQDPKRVAGANEMPRSKTVFDEVLSARPSTMHLLMEEFERRSGGIVAWAGEHGFTADDQNRLKGRLLA